MNKFLTLLSLMLLGVSAFGQSDVAPCATPELSESQRTFLKDFQLNIHEMDTRAGGATIYVPVKIHLVGKSDGTGFFKLEDVFTAMCELNQHFAPSDIYFYLYEDINFIKETTYYNHSFQQGYQMMNAYKVPNALNMFFVGDPAGACGYYSPSADAVAIRISCGGPGNTTITHEVGHYLSLPHTFYGWEGYDHQNPIPLSQQEKVNGSNCGSTGDGFCDTPPDYLSDRWQCPYNGPTLLDPNGDTVKPDPTFYMSYSMDHCTNRFSNQQRGAMRAYLLTKKPTMIANLPPSTAQASLVTLVEPAQFDTTSNYNFIRLSWTKSPEATAYHLRVSRYISYALKEVDMIVTDTSFVVNNLYPNTTYRWSIKPFSEGNTCGGYTTTKTFYTNDVAIQTGITEEITEIKEFYLYPNPMGQGDALNINISSDKAATGQFEVYSITGSLLFNQPVQLAGGVNQYQLNIPNLSAGIYILKYSAPEGNVTKRFVVAE